MSAGIQSLAINDFQDIFTHAENSQYYTSNDLPTVCWLERFVRRLLACFVESTLAKCIRLSSDTLLAAIRNPNDTLLTAQMNRTIYEIVAMSNPTAIALAKMIEKKAPGLIMQLGIALAEKRQAFQKQTNGSAPAAVSTPAPQTATTAQGSATQASEAATKTRRSAFDNFVKVAPAPAPQVYTLAQGLETAEDYIGRTYTEGDDNLRNAGRNTLWEAIRQEYLTYTSGFDRLNNPDTHSPQDEERRVRNWVSTGWVQGSIIHNCDIQIQQGTPLSLDIKDDRMVVHLIEKISKIVQTPFNSLRVSYKGRVLTNGEKLKDIFSTDSNPRFDVTYR